MKRARDTYEEKEKTVTQKGVASGLAHDSTLKKSGKGNTEDPGVKEARLSARRRLRKILINELASQEIDPESLVPRQGDSQEEKKARLRRKMELVRVVKEKMEEGGGRTDGDMDMSDGDI